MIKTTWLAESEERPSFAVIVQTLQSDVRKVKGTHFSKETYAESNEVKNNYVDLSAQ